MEKTCQTCREIKSIGEFHKHSKNKDGLQDRCKTCHATKNRESYQRTKDNPKWRELNWKKRGIQLSVEEYDKLYEIQEGRCLICQIYLERLDVDHCHETLIIRGLLCSGCNKALGIFGDNPETLLRAIQYLLSSRGMELESWLKNQLD